MAALNRDNVQSLVLGPSIYPISRHLLFQVRAKGSGRQFLSQLLGSVSSGEPAALAGAPLVNLSLSWNGLLALGAFDTMGGEAAAAGAFYMFNEPPHAESLRAFGASAPQNWWGKRFSSADIHVIVHIWVTSEAGLTDVTARVRDAAQRCDVLELIASPAGGPITGRQIDGRLLHFGYQDGISHPTVDWDNDQPRQGALARGDFLLGYPSPNYSTYPDKPPFSDFARDGALMAFMMLYQDVAAFNRFLRDNAAEVARGLSQADAEDFLAAKMMGRWRDGTPLMLSPNRRDPAASMRDDFGYADDPQGLRCPLAAHIRVANARDQPLNGLNQTLFPGGFPRVLRRGAPYGPPLAGDEDDGVDRGIVGMFLCANLNKQFYTITRWLSRTDFSPAFPNQVGQDPIIGNLEFPGASAAFTVPLGDGTSVSLARVTDFVRIHGVALQLLPSLAALRGLAS
jgi:deferrochelatase/peroxidase EfeB